MVRKARVITINLNAGTAKFMADVDQAQAKVRGAVERFRRQRFSGWDRYSRRHSPWWARSSSPR